MEDKDVLEEEKKKKGVARGCAGCFKVVASAVAILFLTMYGYFYTQREGPYGYGPYTGVVLDAETREPIEDAQVFLGIHLDTFMEQFGISLGNVHIYFTDTNSRGKYRIRKHVYLPGYVVYSDVELIVYKRGYVAYKSKWIFKDGERKDFKVKDNVILLEKWDDKKFTLKDHSKHVGFMGLSGCRPEARRFCEEAREEMILGCMNYRITRKRCEEIIDEKIHR